MVFYLNIFSSTVGRAKYYFLVFRGTVKRKQTPKVKCAANIGLPQKMVLGTGTFCGSSMKLPVFDPSPPIIAITNSIIPQLTTEKDW